MPSRAQLVCFLTRSKRNTEIDAYASCSIFLDALSDVTVVLGMRQSIVEVGAKFSLQCIDMLIRYEDR